MIPRFDFSQGEKLLMILVAFVLVSIQLVHYPLSRIKKAPVAFELIPYDSPSSAIQNSSAEPAEHPALPSTQSKSIDTELLTTKLHKDHPAQRRTKSLTTVVDINSVTAEELDNLPGIGPTYARRILGFRNALGGFYDVSQVRETYHLPDSVYRKIIPYLAIKTPPKLLSVNSSTEEQLADHPYIAPWEAKKIVEVRAEYGDFSDVSVFDSIFSAEIKDIDLLIHYLSFN